jgi:hypothetical protein
MEKVIKALVLLVERTHAMGERLERIKSKISEFNSTKDRSNPVGVGNTQLAVRPKAHRRTMGRIILALGILGLVSPALPTELGTPMGSKEMDSVTGFVARKEWNLAGNRSSPYGGLQDMLESVAQGIEERQAERKKAAEDIEGRGKELEEVEKNIRRKQTLLEIIAKEIKDEKIKIAEEWEKVSAVGEEGEVVSNCMDEPVQLERMAERVRECQD